MLRGERGIEIRKRDNRRVIIGEIGLCTRQEKLNTGLTGKNIRSQETRRGTVKKKKYIQAEVKRDRVKERIT